MNADEEDMVRKMMEISRGMTMAYGEAIVLRKGSVKIVPLMAEKEVDELVRTLDGAEYVMRQLYSSLYDIMAGRMGVLPGVIETYNDFKNRYRKALDIADSIYNNRSYDTRPAFKDMVYGISLSLSSIRVDVNDLYYLMLRFKK